ncbi:glycoside/pentoside/hexuronide:cation symporter, GPH family [Gemmobacter aquatilis]|uniref:Glycoside/pentoside/hexuronide:cation symporter, GPH family n=2 Tax=Gemmobacter aquatilis TaxID=933059 RepID=A0A1H7ZZY1_9RHOB|nr:glycoside/pentoside/hexuronide:cation symporter, GPH family [Gemmobacter aquatilis]
MIAVATPGAGLARCSLFAAMLAAAGLPIYLHAPKVYADAHGLSLAALGATLAGLRLVDVLQDPALGWLAERTRARRGAMVAGAVALMVGAMLGLFAVAPPVAPLAWFALMLAALFSGWSFLTIVFYAEGVGRAARLGPLGHLRLAGWREAGALLGVCIAAVAPLALGGVVATPFAAFACGFAGLALLATVLMRHEWQGTAATPAAFGPLLRAAPVRRLLGLALVNAAPVAVTSTLFLFFVESRLAAPEVAGPLLVLFFLSAACSAPVWSRLATRIGVKRALLCGMGLAIAAFVGALGLGAGDVAAFALICAASGAAMGADLVLLPALFAREMQRQGQGEAAGFALWSFVSKLSLALAAALLLPLLQARGFTSGATNPPEALAALTLAYAGLPCLLKLTAIALLLRLDLPELTDD